MQSEDHHPPPTCKEEVLWRGACGQSMSELLAKAIYNGEALLYKEARLRPDICDCLTSLLLQQNGGEMVYHMQKCHCYNHP